MTQWVACLCVLSDIVKRRSSRTVVHANSFRLINLIILEVWAHHDVQLSNHFVPRTSPDHVDLTWFSAR